jgi:hypothetical protein
MPDTETPAAAGDNSAASHDILREVSAAYASIDEGRAKLNDDAGKQRKRLRDAGISIPEFMMARRWADEEIEEEDRTTYFDNLKEYMRALGVKQQGSLFGSTKAGKEGDDPRPDFLKNKPAEKADA